MPDPQDMPHSIMFLVDYYGNSRRVGEEITSEEALHAMAAARSSQLVVYEKVGVYHSGRKEPK